MVNRELKKQQSVIRLVLICIGLALILYQCAPFIQRPVKGGGVDRVYETEQNFQRSTELNEQVAKTNQTKVATCPNYGYTKGTWVKDSLDSEYRWNITNSNCYLEKWNTKSFCEILNGRNILIVGDSVNGNLFHSMLSAFGVTDKKDQVQEIFEGRRIPVQQTAYLCDNKSILTFIRNDWLSIDRTMVANVTKNKLFTPWLHFLRFHEVVILNKGAHARPVRHFQKTFVKMNDYLYKNYNGTVIYRTTPRGHINCSVTDTEPIAEANNNEWKRFFEITEVGVENKFRKYMYGLFPTYNAIMKRQVKPPHILLDIVPMLELRPDVHNPPKDCLHISKEKESALDIWLQLLLNALLGNLL